MEGTSRGLESSLLLEAGPALRSALLTAQGFIQSGYLEAFREWDCKTPVGDLCQCLAVLVVKTEEDGFHQYQYKSHNPWGWKGAPEAIQSKPLAKAGSPGANDTGICPGGFGISPERETPPLPWAAVPGLCHPPGQAALPHVEMKLVFSLWPLLLVLLLGTHLLLPAMTHCGWHFVLVTSRVSHLSSCNPVFLCRHGTRAEMQNWPVSVQLMQYISITTQFGLGRASGGCAVQLPAESRSNTEF